MKGYMNNILRINLSKNEIKKEPLSEELVKEYLGGRGFAAKILFDELKPGTDPMGPDNKVVVAAGPLTGVFVPGTGKVTFAAKSPATNSYGDSNMGGHFGPELKYAGYDAIIIEGKSKDPVYIYIDDDTVEIRPATEYWGKGSIQAETLLKAFLGDDFQISTIGPAGENKVYYACVSHDFGRQSGRCGIGAVLGDKKVKAIAIRGTKSIPIHDIKKFEKTGKELFKHCQAHPALKEWQDYGTPSVTIWANESGIFPTRNFSSGHFEDYKKLSATEMRKKVVITDKACMGCPMCCGKYSRVQKKGREAYVEGPEYETIALFGGNCAVGDIEDVTYLNYIADELGLDTISAGNVMGFVMECFEKGIVKKKDLDGIELNFGNVDGMIQIMKKIAAREGIGELLANGVRAASKKFGKGSEKFAMQVKGLEISGYESRHAPAMLLSYMTADIGAHHNRSWAVTHDIAHGREKLDTKAEKAIELQHTRPVFDTLDLCRLQWVELQVPLEKYAEMFQAITGINYSWDDMLKVSERIWNLNRLFLIREHKGIGREVDMPPARVYEEPVPTGSTKGKLTKLKDIEHLLDHYYKLRGWDKNGYPTPEKLKELGLGEYTKYVEKATAKSK
ncbi:MAG: aldehyde ferredoxin oxidoreductase family protein [Armatimonadota bacterium]